MQKIFKAGFRFSIIFQLVFILLTGSRFSFSQQPAQDINKIRTVIIDAGHGGKDPGAIGRHAKEKDIALALSLKVGKYIEEKIPDVKVIYTRKTDEFVSLIDRAKIANNNNADLMISIHVNWAQNETASGTESLILGLHRSGENFEAAKRENQVILLEDNYTVNYEGFDPNSEESYIMFSLMQNIYDEHSIRFADAVQYQFRERAGRKDRGVKRQGLLVLAQAAMPSILIEAGFISNEKEELYMMSEEGQDYLASAIFRAFRDFKKTMESNEYTFAEGDKNENTAHTVNSLPIAPEIDNDKKLNSNNSKITNTANICVDSVLFKVQVLFSERKLERSDSLFNEFNDVQEINTDGRFKYVVGSKNTYNDALEYSKFVKNRYPDAFIVAVCNGKIIPLSEALKVKEN
ncbi:MAG: N-acetylmuramoyl-L-alanine amidase [Bacteroidales bacterium]|nr:N-acetylmuramoyl-L-alanine amidase [Bacteroidales bacterium]